MHQPQKLDEFFLFINLQEDMVDREAELKYLLEENINLKQESSNLTDKLQNLVNEIEEKSYKREFVQEFKKSEELLGPKDRIKETQIRITDKKVVLDIPNVYWGYMLDSNSMDPLLDEGTTILTIKPKLEEDILIGDIIVFNVNFTEHNIVHRVINITKDENGIFFITKGDNNPSEDPLKVRLKNIIAVVVGILY